MLASDRWEAIDAEERIGCGAALTPRPAVRASPG